MCTRGYSGSRPIFTSNKRTTRSKFYKNIKNKNMNTRTNNLASFKSSLNSNQLLSSKATTLIKGGLGDPPPFGNENCAGDPPPFGNEN